MSFMECLVSEKGQLDMPICDDKEQGKVDDYFVSVIISTYNRAQYIGITIDSFLKQTYPENLYEIIVCDNNSTDNTKEVIEAYNKRVSRVRYLFEKRQGLHYVKNYSAQNAKGKILLFTDDDMIARNNLLSELIKVFQENSNVGVATTRILPKWECDPPGWVKKHLNNSLLSLNDLGRKIILTDYDLGVYGCCEAVKKDIFMNAGGFHPDLFGRRPGLGDGETGLNQEIAKSGVKFAYVGTTAIYHIIPSGRMTQRYLNNRFIYSGNASSYSEYRNNPFTKKEIPGRIWNYLKELVRTENRYLFRGLRGKTTLRFSIAIPFYYLARIKYDIRIVYDRVFRLFVENDYWW